MQERAFWQSILDNKGAIPDEANLSELSEELLELLRSPDPELRDTFAYQLLAHWIISGQYDTETLEKFLRRWIADLQTGLGEENTDTVIVRSFAALMLSILVYQDIAEAWILDTNYDSLFDTILEYFLKEQDLRGYDVDKGWLHATAHTADVLRFLARNTKTDAEDLQRILTAICRKIIHPQEIIYTHNEDERLALVILDILKREILSRQILKDWLNQFKELDNGMSGTALNPNHFAAYQNSKHFLQALYFKLSFNKEIPEANELEYKIYQMLQEL